MATLGTMHLRTNQISIDNRLSGYREASRNPLLSQLQTCCHQRLSHRHHTAVHMHLLKWCSRQVPAEILVPEHV